jgi:hypothetical protein
MHDGTFNTNFLEPRSYSQAGEILVEIISISQCLFAGLGIV